VRRPVNAPASGPAPRRSHEPLFWALFGAGGMLLALVGPGLVLATGLAVPLGWLPADTLSPQRVLAFARHPAGALALLGLLSLSLFHAAHRLRHGLHDLGWHPGRAGALACYGGAALGSAAAAVLLWRLA
jgi:fumarate reductase subunit D